MDVRLSVTRNVYKHVGRARIRELQEWFCNLVPSVLIVNQPVEMPHLRYCSSVLYICHRCCSSVLSMHSPSQILQLCAVAAQYCLCAAQHRYCSYVLSRCSPPQILKLCTAYTTDTAALYCLCITYTAALYCLCHRYCSSILSMPQTL